jgi:hypothetical protein
MARTALMGLARFLVVAGIATCFGCGTNWHADSPRFLIPYDHGDYAVAAEQATKVAASGIPSDTVILNVEAGAILRANGSIRDSNRALDTADAAVGDYQQWPQTKVSEELGAALTTVRSITYRGTLSDLVMLNVYRALNYMELGNLDAARSMLIRSAFVQQDIADKYAAELKKAQDQTEKDKEDHKDQFDVDQTMASKDASGKPLQDRLTQDTDPDLLNLQPYANFVNPFSDYLQGIFFLAAAEDSSDRERASTAFKRAASMVRDNPYLKQDVAEADRVANGMKLTPVTYVIFETGTAPERGQIQVPLPLFLANNQAPTVVLYFPTIHSRGGQMRSLQVSAAGGMFNTALVSNMDAVVNQEFKNSLQTQITRMIIGAATKAAIDAGIKQGVKNQSPFVQIGVDVASTVYQVEMNQADLRTWRTLPKQFQVARIPTPSDRMLTLLPTDGTAPIPVNLPEGKVNVVYVKSVHAGIPPVVRQFVLNNSGAGGAKVADAR